jgi:hypothetical protein
MITDEAMRHKIKRFHQRKSKNLQRFYANQYGKDLIIWRSLCAMHTQERIEKDQKRFLTTFNMTWLLAMKMYCIEKGVDSFFMRDIKSYMNYNFKQIKSSRNAVETGKKLKKAGYIMAENPMQQRGRLVLTMKARVFYQDLAELFSI